VLLRSMPDAIICLISVPILFKSPILFIFNVDLDLFSGLAIFWLFKIDVHVRLVLSVEI
jgi:hypothetical protein